MTTTVATEYESVIGLEVHAQLLTRSKMFCTCASDYQGAPPNTRVCPVCMALPGSLPVINKKAVEYVMMTGLALHCTIPEHTKFDRKNYPYPDLMKGYQISQFDQPIAKDGRMMIRVDGKKKPVRINRVHLEEDVAKLFHRSDATGETYSLLDVNRAGVPLMETVSEPDLRSPEEARQYLIQLRAILRRLGVSTGNMDEGSFRCDANISIRPVGDTELGPKVEVKNMNSFRAVVRALEYEFTRQVQVVREGGRIVQETRGWLEERGGYTVSQRSKEQAHDYRYFPEPDLPPLVISRQWEGEMRSRVPELPEECRIRFMSYYALPDNDATQLAYEDKQIADLFELAVMLSLPGIGLPQAYQLATRPLAMIQFVTGLNVVDNSLLQRRAKSVSNWTLGETLRLLNAAGHIEQLDSARVLSLAQSLAQVVNLLEANEISMPTAKRIFELSFQFTFKGSDFNIAKYIADHNLHQISEDDALEGIIMEVIASNPQPKEDYIKGKDTAIRSLMGQIMKRTRGQANPQIVGTLLTARLDLLRQIINLLSPMTNAQAALIISKGLDVTDRIGLEQLEKDLENEPDSLERFKRTLAWANNRVHSQ